MSLSNSVWLTVSTCLWHKRIDGLDCLPVEFRFSWGKEHTLLTYYRDGNVGRLMFGFEPKDSDLVETAGWAVLMMKIGDYLLEQSRPCREVRIGQVVTFNTLSAVRISSPDGTEQTLTPTNGKVSIGGLDQVGKYRVFDDRRSMWLMVRKAGQERRSMPSKKMVIDGSVSPTTVHRAPLRRQFVCYWSCCSWGAGVGGTLGRSRYYSWFHWGI